LVAQQRIRSQLQIFELAFGEAVAMAIDFTLTKTQREIQLQSRKFAREVLAEAAKCETLATPEERFLATKPIYEAMVAAGYLRKNAFQRQRVATEAAWSTWPSRRGIL
jgi:hypothetical protein